MKRCAALRCCLLAALLLGPAAAFAYRPFVSTDAAVADTGHSEVELGFLDLTHDHSDTTVASPNFRYNYGFARDWEFSLEAALQLYDSTRPLRLGVVEPEFSVKHVLLEGPLQEGPHLVGLAVELSALLPQTGASGWGTEGVAIASFRTGEFTWHLNLGGEWARQTLAPTLAWGVIVEHPIVEGWRIATELNGEAARGATADTSMLLGLLHDRGKITYDAGVRFGLSKAAPQVMFTLGLTTEF